MSARRKPPFAWLRPGLLLGLALILVAKGLSVWFDAPWIYWIGAFKGVVICIVDLVRAADHRMARRDNE